MGMWNLDACIFPFSAKEHFYIPIYFSFLFRIDFFFLWDILLS
jgi:hypothetical protein